MSGSISPSEASYVPDEQDRRLIVATQQGLPLVSDPWAELAAQLDMSPEDVLARFRNLQQTGGLRRIAAVPNHYRLGYRYNGMTVWDVEDQQVSSLGTATGMLPFVSHCYRRPRHLPLWPYNLFAMVHGTCKEEVEEKAAQIRKLLGDACRQHNILYSSAILKKTGLRLKHS